MRRRGMEHLSKEGGRKEVAASRDFVSRERNQESIAMRLRCVYDIS